MTGPPSPTIGLALIARDEQETLPRLLASCAGAFDEIVLVDTGSIDATVAVFEAWGEGQPDTSCKVAHFAWCDDFGAARRFAADQLDSDWHVWADCDDEIRGAGELRRIAAEAPAEVAGFSCGYDYDNRGAAAPVYLLQRERLVRAGRGRWVGRIHEFQEIDGPLLEIDPARVLWAHHGDGGADGQLGDTPRAERDLSILAAQVRDDPYDRRAAFYLAQTFRDLGRVEHAIPAYERRIELGGWEEEVYYARLQLGVLLADRGDWGAGLAELIDAWEYRPARIEALYEIAWRLRVREQHRTALAFILPGLDASLPADRLFVHRWVYEWGMLFEHSIAGYWAGDVAGALRSCERLLALDSLPEAHRTQTHANRAFCIERLRREARSGAGSAA